MFAVACHRLVLLGSDSAAPTFVPRWESRSWKFLIYLAILELILVVAPALLAELFFNDFEFADSQAEEVGDEEFDLLFLGIYLVFFVSALLAILFIFAPLTYVWMRFSFVFPATAVDQNFGFARSWHETRKHGLRLTALVLFVSVPFISALLAMSVFLPDECQGTSVTFGTTGDFEFGCFTIDSFPVTVINSGLSYIMIAFTVTLLSIAFRTCTGWVPAASSAPVGTDESP